MMPAPTAIVAGPPAFTTPQNIYVSSTVNSMVVRFETDQLCQCQIQFVQTDPPAMSGTAPVITTVTDPGPLLVHTLTLTPTVPGQMFQYTISLAPTDTSGLFMRPYVQQFRVDWVRISNPQRSVPVRFYMFGGTPPPGAGGSAPPGPGNNGPNIGNWSTYTWSQYNPKGTTYPAP